MLQRVCRESVQELFNLGSLARLFLKVRGYKVKRCSILKHIDRQSEKRPNPLLDSCQPVLTEDCTKISKKK